jgi:ABC-type oligopeptide transport system ATPase subunit
MLSVENVSKVFPLKRARLFGERTLFRALDRVNLAIPKGASFGLVGESGSGKTTLSRCILRLDEVSEGRILFDGNDMALLTPPELRRLRARIQIVFQDPYASLDPRMTIHDIVAEPLVIHHKMLGLDARQRTDRVVELLGHVGLNSSHLYRFPHEFSGGQRQRVGIARALAPKPDFLVLDEPTSALDVSVQADVLNLLHKLQGEFGLTYLFISHDLGVIRYICDSVAVIHRGRIVEEGPIDQIFERPGDDYTSMLISAMPDPDPDRSPFRQEGRPDGTRA